MKKIFLVFGAIAVVILATVVVVHNRGVKQPPLVLTSERHVTLSDLAKESDLIVLGTAGTSSSRVVQTESGGLPYSDWQVEPLEVWKGVAPSSLVASELVSLSDADISKMSNPAATLKVGKTFLFFLDYLPNDDLWSVSQQQSIVAKDGSGYRNLIGDRYDESAIKEAITQYAQGVPSLSVLADQTSLAVYGSVTKGITTNRNVNNQEIPFTSWIITPSKTHKGTMSGPVTVSWKGGSDGKGNWVPYEIPMDMTNGMEALFLLKQDDSGEWLLVSVEHGVFLQHGNRYIDPNGVGYSEAEMLAAVGSK